MMDTTMELISMAASNSLFVFCFCNLIIAILLVDGTKSASDFATHSPVSQPRISQREEDCIRERNIKCDNNVTTMKGGEFCTEEETSNEEEDEEDDDDDDELRRRAEEFINKINSVWKEEKMKASLSLYSK